MRKVVLHALWLALALGCGDGERPAPGDPAGGDADPTGADADGRPASCPASAAWVVTVSGRIADEGGAGIVDARAQLCVRLHPSGELQCVWPARADAQGLFTVEVPASGRCMTAAVMRVLSPGADRATVYCPLALPLDQAAVSIAAPYVLPATARATSLPPRGDAQTVRTVVFAGGLELDVAPARFVSTAGYDALAAVRLPASTTSACLPAGHDAVEVVAFSPEGDVSGAPFAARLTNTAALPVSSVVDLFVLGGLSCTLADGTHVPEGVWQAAGEGSVAADGATLSVDVPCLTWLAYAPR